MSRSARHLAAVGQASDLSKQRTKRMLRQMVDDPFVTVVFEDGHVRVYVREDVTDAHFRALKEAFEELEL